jgi:hypothetical protein
MNFKIEYLDGGALCAAEELRGKSVAEACQHAGEDLSRREATSARVIPADTTAEIHLVRALPGGGYSVDDA